MTHTPAAHITRSKIIENVGLAFDALGSYREREGGLEVVEWAMSLSRRYLSLTTT